MRIARPLVCLLLLIVLSASAAHAEIKLNGTVSNQMRLRLLQNDMPEDYDWDFTMLLSKIDVILRAQDDERTARLFANIDFRHDPTGVFENDFEWRLREVYAGYYQPYYSVEIGKRIYAWGLADEFNPTDLLNPEDYRWFISVDKTDRKIGVYSANLALNYENFNLQGVVIPVFEPVLLPEQDSDWRPWQLVTLDSLVGAFPDYVDLQEDTRPEMTANNAEVAAKLAGTVATVDFQLVYFNGFDDQPTFDINIIPDPNVVMEGGKPLVLREEYQRYAAYGGSFAFTVDKFSLRGEGAYYTPRYYMYEFDDSLMQVGNLFAAFDLMTGLADHTWRVRKPSWSAVGGVDYRSGSELYVNMQYVHTQILDYEEDLLYEENEGMVTLKVQSLLLDEDLDLSFQGAANVWHGDWYIKPYVRYKLTVDLAAEVGIQLYGGDEKTTFGDMDDNDFVYTLVEYAF
ncbi:MAG TPA: hypothetical protein PKW95_21350 [bacterium]|nr:hypothetical protein [bacterium]